MFGISKVAEPLCVEDLRQCYFFLSSLYSADLDGGILCLLIIFNKKYLIFIFNCNLQ